MIPWLNQMKQPVGYALLFALMAFLFFPQVGLLQQPLKWDAIDCFLAWRLNVSDALHNGELPWWSTFQHLGYPMHADPDTGAFYPVVWLISLIYGYDFYALQLEFCFHVFIAGWGMFRLMRHLNFSSLTSLLIGIAFMSNGVFVSNAQNYAFLIGMAWFPWVFQSLRETIRRPHLTQSFTLATLLFLWLSGSYPGVVIIGAYVLLTYIIYYFIKNASTLLEQWKKLLPQYVFHVIIPVLFIVAFPVVASFETYQDITRTAGLDAGRINENPFPLKAYISWFTPYAVGTRSGVDWGSDFSMINFFLGLPFLLGIAGWSVQRKLDNQSILALGVAVGLMIAALGGLTPVRMWLAHLPAMGLFRHPSIFRFIGSVFFLIAAAGGLEYLIHHANEKRKRLAVAFVGIPYLLLIGFGMFYMQKDSFSLAWSEWIQRRGESNLIVEQRMVIQSVCFFAVLAFMFIMPKRNSIWIAATIVVAILSVQMNVYNTVVSEGVLARYNDQLHRVIQERSPYQGESIAPYHTDSIDLGIPIIWRNEATYLQKPGWDGYNSLILKNYNALEESGELKRIAQNALLFSADTLSETTFSNWHLTSIGVVATVFAERETNVVLLQTAIKGWTAQLNQEPLNITSHMDGFPMVRVPKGEFQLSFQYIPQWSTRALIFSFISWAMLFVVVVYFRFKPFGRS